MDKQEVIETVFGRRSKYEVVRVAGWSTKFYVYKDGSKHRGPYGDLRDAVQKAKEDAAKEG
jgi:hypothetical protein